jgi:hypothetical protein
MRTTIDLDETLLERLRNAAHFEGVSFKAMLHRVILRGLDTAPRPAAEVRYETPTFSMGKVREGVDLVKARWIADDLEDEEIMRKMAEGR